LKLAAVVAVRPGTVAVVVSLFESLRSDVGNEDIINGLATSMRSQLQGTALVVGRTYSISDSCRRDADTSYRGAVCFRSSQADIAATA